MRKMLILVIALLAISARIYAQNIFFPTEVGTVLTYVQKDNRGRIENHTRYTITSVEGTADNMTISYLFETMDRNWNVTAEIPGKMIIRDGKMIFDVQQMIAQYLQDSRANVEVTGTFMEVPINMSPGQTFDDTGMTINIERGILRMNVRMSITDGKCLAIENITVAAGTFESYKMTQTINTTILRRTNSLRVVSWNVPNVGQVKSRTYNERNQLQHTTELVEIK
jgi:hypothetical protein